jgi:hypothetical protein
VSRIPVTPVDWNRVARTMRRSFTRGSDGVDPECEAAYREDPERYARLHAEIKGQEIAAIRSLGGNG